MSFTASLLFSVALAVQPDSGLRLVNPHYVAVDATLSCGERHHAVRLEPQEIRDLTTQALCAAPQLDASLPLLAFETDGEAKQRILGTDDTCAPVIMSAPLFGCERGTATASVPLLDGATYAWTAEGATITAGAGTNRVSATLGEGASAKLVCVVTHAGCSSDSTGVIAIRKPLLIHELKVPAQVDAADPVTITWTYEPGAVPNAQLLTGDVFAAPVALDGSQRSYTFTPSTSGMRNVELLASYSPSIHPPATSQGRRRAVGSTLATATQCPSARATAKLEIVGCALTDLEIVAPADIESGSTFFASVDVNPGDGVEWEVTNGTLVSLNFIPQIEIRADDLASNVRIAVRVIHSAECQRIASTDVNVHPRAVCATNPPTAALSVISQECYNATIQVSFTGTPPFSGKLAGVEFETSSATMTQVVNTWEDTTFGITGFHDSICSGVAGTLTVPTMRPDAILTATGGGCTTDSIVATLIGTPPFHGEWNDGETFTTSGHTIERTNVNSTASYFIRTLTDATCTGPATLTRVELVSAPHLILPTEPFCQRAGGVYVVAGMGNTGRPPYTVEWSDGVVSTSNYHYAINRYYTEMASTQLHVVRASDARCQAVVPNPTATVIYRPAPEIDAPFFTCDGKSGQAALESPLPGASLQWSITNGTITGGQGTGEITFQPAGLDPVKLTVSASYPDGYCSESTSQTVQIEGNSGEIAYLKAEPATIAPGGTSTVSFRIIGAIRWLQLDVDPHSRYSDLKWGDMVCTLANFCSTQYVDSKGVGNPTIGVYYGGDCIADGASFTTLEIK